eukprot:CAMPEP_0171379898 /NCGR_PEP_ID=MMETSP0879-20121228/27919_1 /TAXON_ID=67004 /ORGANISM="Thalassiosira weissflogii, Strain CCMP1336" /LENGTH=364 /DNA_ID=CAMNT_0011890819 /DNA_START=28 /DNA_END=1122 /DNA_ORIENTATION=+
MQYPNHPPTGGGIPSFPPPPPPPQPTQPLLPPGWVQTTDPTSGRPYYANPTTGQTSWEPPPYFPPPPPPAVNPSIPPPRAPHHAPQFQQPPYTNPFPQTHHIQPQQNNHVQPQIIATLQQGKTPSIAQPTIPTPAAFHQPSQDHLQHPQILSYHNAQTNFQNPPQNCNNDESKPTQQPTQPPHHSITTTTATNLNSTPSIPIPSTSTATFNLGPSTATTPGLLVPSVRSMIEAEITQKANSSSIPRLELDGLTAGCIADLCNVSREYRSRNLRVDKGDFADDDEKNSDELKTSSVGGGSGKGSGISFSTNTCNGNKNSEEEEAMNQYYLPMQPYQLPMASRPPHIEPGRVDIRLHALYNKLGRI